MTDLAILIFQRTKIQPSGFGESAVTRSKFFFFLFKFGTTLYGTERETRWTYSGPRHANPHGKELIISHHEVETPRQIAGLQLTPFGGDPEQANMFFVVLLLRVIYKSVKRSHHVRREGLEILTLI